MEKFVNTLWTRDNLEILHGLNSESVDLIYLDPPFNSKRLYSAPIGSKAAGAAFKDTWTWSDVDEAYLERLVTDYPSVVRLIETAQVIDKSMAAYLTYMAQRVIEMHRVLKSTGSIYLHCDPTAGHWLKLLLDGVFGKKCFKNEIIWSYESGGRAKNFFSRKHDDIYFYTKSDKHIFNGDAIGIPKNECQLCGAKLDKWNNLKKLVGPDGRTYRTIKSNGKIYEYYDDEPSVPTDVWIGINHLQQKDPERTGYPTQKPLALLHRIIKASSNIGDIVLDPFCGCATACVAAQQLQRRWIGIDIEEKAADILIERLTNDAGLFTDFVHRKDIPQRTDIQNEPISNSVKERLFVIQKGKCAGCGKEFDILNLEVDHIVPRAKGGGDYFENYQLLCGACNRIKGARPMEYLRQKIRIREATMQHITFGE
jgi:site-specific DNA-methyltransferase (adenine-specific)